MGPAFALAEVPGGRFSPKSQTLSPEKPRRGDPDRLKNIP